MTYIVKIRSDIVIEFRDGGYYVDSIYIINKTYREYLKLFIRFDPLRTMMNINIFPESWQLLLS